MPLRGPLLAITTCGWIAHNSAGAPDWSLKNPWWVASSRETRPSLFTGHARSVSLSHVRSPTSRNVNPRNDTSTPVHCEFSVVFGGLLSAALQYPFVAPPPLIGFLITSPCDATTSTCRPASGIVSPA